MNSIQKRASEHLKKQKELLDIYTKEEDKKLIEIAINKYEMISKGDSSMENMHEVKKEDKREIYIELLKGVREEIEYAKAENWEIEIVALDIAIKALNRATCKRSEIENSIELLKVINRDWKSMSRGAHEDVKEGYLKEIEAIEYVLELMIEKLKN